VAVQRVELGMGDDPVQVSGNSSDVFVDGPLVVIQDDQQLFRMMGDIVQRFEGDATSKRGIARERTTCSDPPCLSRATAMPKAAESAVPAWPAP